MEKFPDNIEHPGICDHMAKSQLPFFHPVEAIYFDEIIVSPATNGWALARYGG